jgi:hypothetical protein
VTAVRLSVAIQAHPARTDQAEALAAATGGTVVYDPDPDGHPSPWRTYRAALDATPADATHRLIIQDDAVACAGFRAAAEAAVAARPTEPVTFYHGGQPREHISRLRATVAQGLPWATFTRYRYIPAVALSWPVGLIAPSLAWIDEQRWPVEFSADDEIIGRAFTQLRQPLHVTVPSLVQHTDMGPSLVRRYHRPGDPGRIAAFYIGDHDAASIPW